ncbi:MAG: hypothetical protein ACTSRE_04690 [Promethearchaeota archaeon]
MKGSTAFWRFLGLIGTGTVFAIFLVTMDVIWWFYPDLLNLPYFSPQEKMIFIAISGVLFLICIFMIVLGIWKNLKQKSTTDTI